MLKLRSERTRSAPAPDLVQKSSFSQTKGTAVDSKQVLITIAGVEAKVGATHLALSLALKASQCDMNCAVIIAPESFEALKQYYFLSVHEILGEGQSSEARQFATFAGLNIMTGILPGDLEGFRLVIWDCGRLPQAQRRFLSGDLCCLLSGGQAWELGPLNEVLMNLSYEELNRYLVCIRGAAESELDHLQQQMAGKLACINIMHKPDWSDVALREDLVAILRYAD